MLGEAAWDVAWEAGHDRISLQDAKLGAEKSKGIRQGFYAERMEEFSKRGILAEAKAVSKAMSARGKNPRLPYEALDRVLKEAVSVTGNQHLEVRRSLLHLGLVWLLPDAFWEPGIPSLCDFLAGQAEEGSDESGSCH